MHTRLSEHERNTRGKGSYSALGEHSKKFHHKILFEDAKILCYEPNETKRKIKEALLMKSCSKLLENNTPSFDLKIFKIFTKELMSE